MRIRGVKTDVSNISCPDGAKLIPLTKGHYAIVDDDDYESLMAYSWYAEDNNRSCYATTSINGIKYKMHHLILKADYIDHGNINSLDNRKSNLRKCTPAQNMANTRVRLRSTSGYKGVTWYKRYGKWRAGIGFKKKYIFLGFFDDKTEAAIAYDKKAIELYGEFANINIK